MREYMEKDIRQSLQEHIFRLENRRRELMRPEYLRLGLTIGQGQPRILMYLLSPRCDDALAHAGPSGGKRAFGAAHQSTVASGVPDLSDRGGKEDGSRGLQLLLRNGKKDVQRAD